MGKDEIIHSPLGREQLVALAREAGFGYIGFPPEKGEWCCKPDALERFAALVAAHEREACAKVCEERSHRSDDMGAICAAAIRARAMDILTQHSQAIGEYNDYP